MKTKTSDLIGPALDWVVATLLGKTPVTVKKRYSEGWFLYDREMWDKLEYSTDWSQGGPIVDWEKIDIQNTITEGGYRTSSGTDACRALITLPNGATVFDAKMVVFEYGPTPLIAAMRCFVASRLGDEVDVPDELV